MDKKDLDRINYLARKSRSEGLSAEEKDEQAKLRCIYLEEFRRSFKSQLDCIEFVDKDEGKK